MLPRNRHLYALPIWRVLIAIFAPVLVVAIFGSLYSSPPALSPIPLRQIAAPAVEPTPARRLSSDHHVPEAEPAASTQESMGLTTVGCTRPTRGSSGGWTRPNTVPDWTDADRSRVRRIIAIVSDEMGAAPYTVRMLQHWAARESDSRPHEVHIMRGDVRAARSRRSRERIAAIGRAWSPAWSYGRGLYGMQPSYYLARWDAQASLDVLCDPVAATVIAVWAAREHQTRCVRRGFAPSLLVSNRRWASGHCKPRAKDAKTRAYWAERSIDVDATRAKWGSAWPEETTNRRDLLVYLRELLASHGL